jgi:hypothetical protein
MVERRDLHDPVPFGGSNNGRVDAAKRQVVILGDELRDPDQIGSVDRLEPEAAGSEVSEEPDFRLPARPCGEQVYDFSNDKTRDQQWTGIGLQEFPAGQMVSIVGVDVAPRCRRGPIPMCASTGVAVRFLAS